MTLHPKAVIFYGAVAAMLAGAAIAQPPGSAPRSSAIAPPPQAGSYTSTSGTIAQLNYNRDALPDGFLLADRTLVHLPPTAAPLLGSTLKPGDRVEIAGMANTSASGFKTIQAQQLTDRTSGKSFTVPQPGAAAPYSGSGKIEQLNYGPDGSINGFLLENGTFATVRPFSAANPSAIRPGITVSFTGYARTSIAGRTVVDLQSITVNGQTITMLTPATPAPPPRPRRRGVTPPPAAAPAPPAASATPGAPPAPPDGRTDQPPPPPAPPAVQ